MNLNSSIHKPFQNYSNFGAFIFINYYDNVFSINFYIKNSKLKRKHKP